MQTRNSQFLNSLWPWIVALGIAAFLFGGLPALVTQAAPQRQLVALRETALTGSLPYQFTAHYLGLEPTIRDSVVSLTLAYDPQNNPNLRGFVSFFVLNEDGLRRFLAGDDPMLLSIASGSPVQFDPVGNKVNAVFRDSGRGKYTVIVYNNSQLPVTYTLFADGGVLVDNANQTTALAAGPKATPQPEVPAPAEEDTLSQSYLLPGSVTGRRVQGSLKRKSDRHYLSVTPDIRDGSLLFYFKYDSLDQPNLRGNVNFLVLDEEALRQVVNGAKPVDLNLAMGYPIPFNALPNELQANFNASGKNPYTVMIYNDGEGVADYTFSVDGGLLVDQYGQTQSVAEPTPAPPTPVAAPPPTFAVPQLAGNFTQPYQYHYYGLTPNIRDGLIVLTLDSNPRISTGEPDQLNFMVLDEDGLRRVLSGGRPQDYDLATGSSVRFGADQGKLRTVFNASAHGHYTVIVFSNEQGAAQYLLSAEGGVLATEEVSGSLP